MKPARCLFDAGNTLVFLDYARLASAVGERTGSCRSPSRGFAAMPVRRPARWNRGASPTGSAVRCYLLTLFELAGVPVSRAGELKAALLALHQQAHLWGATPVGTREALERLRAAGFRLAVISNSDGRAAAALEAAGLRDLFEFVIDSGEVGVEKPDPRIFHIALERLGVPAADALYVGDLYEVDAVGARGAGLGAVLLDPDGAHAGRDIETVDSVSQLADRLLATCIA